MLTLGNIGFIGGGNMGNSLVGGLIHRGHPANKIWVADFNEETCTNLQKKWGINTSTDNKKVAISVDILVLAVKPQTMQNVVKEIAPDINRSKPLVMSIAAGITTKQIQRWLDNPLLAVIRAMPNTPALLGQGIAGLYATDSVSALQQQMAEQLLQAVGTTVWISEEPLMDVVTALSGSGPAYFFYMMEGLIKGGMALGLPHDVASKLTFNTALGSAMMALGENQDILILREKVTSKGGTTEQGIKILNDGKLHELLLKTLTAATLRGKALSEQFD